MIHLPPEAAAGKHDRETWFRTYKAIGQRTVVGAHGIELIDIGDDGIVLEMPITDAVRQPYGFLHGGMSLMLAEEAASAHAAWGLDLTARYPVGIEVSGSHLRSCSEGRVRATARVLRRSTHVVVHDVRITHVESGETLSVVRVTNLIRDRTDPSTDVSRTRNDPPFGHGNPA